ncbi:polysaccharide pyruvyl transferase family protein [Butyrivibrio sp.]|uniref:polysaccharide pyruvyl transferase family protein n=1 Tax=Butyrivibrio sp. TaxID=28121 RepID=UPI0025B97DDE|nr:polysaccharide pyruvyl transferase family protein [Butyrivibrio sp.]MBE5839553.1 hypothetical protein [Butyrivibrio sp.]
MNLRERIKQNKLLYFITIVIYFPFKAIKMTVISIRNYSDGLVALNKVSSNKNNIYYCCVPEHKNMGDLAQYYCIKKWIHSNYENYNLIELPTRILNNRMILKKMKKSAKKGDIFVFQSGYTTHDIHPDHSIHKKMVLEFKDNKIVFFPQTVNFIKDSEGKESGAVFDSNSNVLFLARDDISYAIAKEYMNTTRIQLYPDIVTSLIGRKKLTNERNGILLCMRNDLEKYYSDEQICELKRRLESSGMLVDCTDTESYVPFGELKKNFSKYFDEIITNFSKYKVIITDRYHGTIFSLISNTPVIILKTNDHKVVTGAKWFEEIYDSYVTVARSLDEACNIAETIYNDFEYRQLPNYFERQYYSKLKRIIENEN